MHKYQERAEKSKLYKCAKTNSPVLNFHKTKFDYFSAATWKFIQAVYYICTPTTEQHVYLFLTLAPSPMLFGVENISRLKSLCLAFAFGKLSEQRTRTKSNFDLFCMQIENGACVCECEFSSFDG